MRLLICAGGTGGGVYPALAVFQALNAEHPQWKHSGLAAKAAWKLNSLRREGIPFTSIPAAGLHGVGLRALPRNLVRLHVACLRHAGSCVNSSRTCCSSRAASLPGRSPLLAHSSPFNGKIPTLVYVPDIEPGLALKSLSHFADRIAVSAADSAKYFKGKVVVTGYPVRPDLMAWTRQSGRAALRLDDNLPVLLVAGGARARGPSIGP